MESLADEVEASYHIARKLKIIQVTVDLDKLKHDSTFHVISHVNDLDRKLQREHVFGARNLQEVQQWEDRIGKFSEENSSPVHVVISNEAGKEEAIWYKSFGDWSSLRPHLSQHVEKIVVEEELIAELELCDEKVVVISGEFGMGKSTTLRWLMNKMKIKHPEKEEIIIDLASFKLDEQHLHNVFERMQKSSVLPTTSNFSDIIVLFDSFELIHSNHEKHYFDLFEQLIKRNVHLILVATLQHREMNLYRSSRKIYRLEPLSLDQYHTQLAKVANKSGKFFQIVLNKGCQLQTPLLIKSLFHLAEDQPKNNLLNAPKILHAFENMCNVYVDHYIHRVLQIGKSNNYAVGEFKALKREMYNDLGLLNIGRFLGNDIKTVLRKSECAQLKVILRKSCTVNYLLEYAPDLNHSTFCDLFIAHNLFKMYVDLQDIQRFRQLFENLLKAEELVNVFFFQMLSTRFVKSESIDLEDHIQFVELLETFHQYTKDEQLKFVVKRNLPGCLRILLQNGFELKLKMILTVLAHDFFEIIDFLHVNDILLTMHEWTISQIASDYKFVRTINHLKEKFTNFKSNREKSETTIKIHSARRKLETSAVPSQEFLMEDVQRAKRARLRTDRTKIIMTHNNDLNPGPVPTNFVAEKQNYTPDVPQAATTYSNASFDQEPLHNMSVFTGCRLEYISDSGIESS